MLVHHGYWEEVLKRWFVANTYPSTMSYSRKPARKVGDLLKQSEFGGRNLESGQLTTGSVLHHPGFLRFLTVGHPGYHFPPGIGPIAIGCQGDRGGKEAADKVRRCEKHGGEDGRRAKHWSAVHVHRDVPKGKWKGEGDRNGMQK